MQALNRHEMERCHRQLWQDMKRIRSLGRGRERGELVAWQSHEAEGSRYKEGHGREETSIQLMPGRNPDWHTCKTVASHAVHGRRFLT